MALTVSDVTDRFPELAGADATALGECLTEAIETVDRDCFGPTLADRATLYLAAHLYASTSGALAKGVTSVSAGSASISYGGASAGEDYRSTGYGRNYVRLARMCTGAQVLC